MKTTSRISFILLSVLLMMQSIGAFAQRGNFTMDYSNAQQFFADINGRPLYLKVDYFVGGPAFHPSDYFLATIVMPGGKAYRDIPVKFNLMENLLIYRTPSGQELVSVVPAVRVVYTDTADYGKMHGKIFERGYGSINSLGPDTWYEVLDTGMVQLLKHYRVYYTDQKHYNSPSISRVFFEKEDYYIALPDGSVKKLDKGAQSIVDILPDKKDKITAFITRENLKCKKEGEWKRVIAFYNTLE